MTMQLSEREAMTIVAARKYAKIQRISRYIILVVLATLFIMSTDGTIDVYHFRALTLVLAALIFTAPYNRLPSYQALVDLLDKKSSESADALEALAEAKSGSRG